MATWIGTGWRIPSESSGGISGIRIISPSVSMKVQSPSFFIVVEVLVKCLCVADFDP
jgi:hypothetical protein